MRFFFTLFLFLLLANSSLKAQRSDTSLIADTLLTHSPAKATLFSAVVPGLGQAYNKKYWKVPLALAAIATPLYFALDQRSKFEDFKSAYAMRVDDDPESIDKYIDIYTNDNLLSLIDFHRKNRDLLFVLTGVGYALNILDAAVDAHLFYLDVGDDLTADIRPSFQYAGPRQMVPSITLNLKFTKKSRQHAY